MSGIIEFEFNPGQTVWVIEQVSNCGYNDTTPAVREGVVLQVRATLQLTTVPASGSPLVYDAVVYDVRIGTLAGSKTFNPDNVFATLNDAITEYQTRV